ncbi:hypothetical protein FQZ97_488630 [compost metagenome]
MVPSEYSSVCPLHDALAHTPICRLRLSDAAWVCGTGSVLTRPLETISIWPVAA